MKNKVGNKGLMKEEKNVDVCFVRRPRQEEESSVYKYSETLLKD